MLTHLCVCVFSPGSSAGAGSGEFHVYRGFRRREYARQAYINGVAEVVSMIYLCTQHETMNKVCNYHC